MAFTGQVSHKWKQGPIVFYNAIAWHMYKVLTEYLKYKAKRSESDVWDWLIQQNNRNKTWIFFLSTIEMYPWIDSIASSLIYSM